jgi:tRNA 5-methylaminomethyl-2-thiouridine biosynthesis bifunctional protein
MPAPLTAGRIVFDERGVPRSTAYDDVYHAAEGGPEQARHVFLSCNDLPQRWRGREAFAILETGFGLGLNFLCTAHALLADAEAPARLHYVAVEKHPPLASDLERAHARWPQWAALGLELRRAWPPLLPGFHRVPLAGGRIVLTLLFGEAASMLAELDARIDAIFLDGFAPAKNPAMWSQAVFRQIGRLSAAGTSAATWTVAAAVRDGLQSAGFAISKRPGFARKREMLTAARPGIPSATPRRQRHAAIIGAGLAGSWLTYALAQRGWTVELIERHNAPAREASGNLVGAVRPAINRADNVNARLARAAFLYTARTLGQGDGWYGTHARCGVLHVATDACRAERMAQIAREQSFPDDYMRWVDIAEANRLAGTLVAGPGFWIPAGGWAAPRALCEALLAHAGRHVVQRFGAAAHAIERTAAGWRIADTRGQALAQAPIVMMAAGSSPLPLGSPWRFTYTPVRGQVTYLPPAAERRLQIVVGGDGYLAPLPQGGHCVGATFEPDSNERSIRGPEHALNLARAQRLVLGFGAGLDAGALAGWAGIRTATPDRLPVYGPLAAARTEDGAAPDCEDLYLATGLGARGLIWAPLGAEVLAARLNDEPLPIESSLLAAIDPQRLAQAAPE